MTNLTQRQQALLEDVSALAATASGSSSKPVKEEDFYRFFQKMERQYEEETESLAYLTNWGWIFQNQQICHQVFFFAASIWKIPFPIPSFID